jgi:hypothetical protein
MFQQNRNFENISNAFERAFGNFRIANGNIFILLHYYMNHQVVQFKRRKDLTYRTSTIKLSWISFHLIDTVMIEKTGIKSSKTKNNVKFI